MIFCGAAVRLFIMFAFFEFRDGFDEQLFKLLVFSTK